MTNLSTSNILDDIQKKADAMWVSASSDLFRTIVKHHQYEETCECNWCDNRRWELILRKSINCYLDNIKHTGIVWCDAGDISAHIEYEEWHLELTLREMMLIKTL